MKILHVICQKPHSTGSGVYMSELISSMTELNHQNAAIYAIENDEDIFYDEKIVKNYPVKFSSDNLPFNVFGMSDEMPYDSSQFKNMTEEIFDKYKSAFLRALKIATEEFKPDLIICHHLYITTAITRELVKDIRVVGICHNTDIRQFIKTHFKNDYIKENIKNLDCIFSPTKYIKEEIIDIYNIDENKIKILGTGYNHKIFYNMNKKKNLTKNRFIYVGKIAKAKGVLDLVKSFKSLEDDLTEAELNNISLTLAGQSGNHEEYNQIMSIFNSLRINKINYGMVDKKTLSGIYNENNVFIITSYTEAVPLTCIEALSCGLKVIVSDIPGIREFLTEHIEDAYIDYVELPILTNVDEITDDEMKKFEKRIKNSIIKAINDKKYDYKNIINNVSWESLCEIIINS